MQRPDPVCKYALLWSPVQFLFSFTYDPGTTQLHPRLKTITHFMELPFCTRRTFCHVVGP